MQKFISHTFVFEKQKKSSRLCFPKTEAAINYNMI